MANIIIGRKNLVVDARLVPTVTASTESADWDADNLTIAHPSEVHRFTSLSGMWEKFDFTTTSEDEFFNLICPLYVTCTPQRNLLSDSYFPAITDWVTTNVDLVNTSPSLTPVPSQTFLLQETTSGGPENHRATQAYTFSAATPRAMTVHCRVYAYQALGARNARVTLGNGTDNGVVVLTTNAQQPAYFSSSASGSATLDSYSVTDVGDNWTKVEMTVTIPASSSSVNIYLDTLDSSYSYSYNGSDTLGSKWCAPQVYLNGSEMPCIDDVSVIAGRQAPHYDVEFDQTTDFGSPTYSSLPQHLCASPGLGEARGWSHGRPVIVDESNVTGASINNRNFVRVRYSDPDTATMDVSNVFIGQYWQPTRNVADGWVINPAAGSPSVGVAYGNQEYRSQQAEPRELTLRLAYESSHDAFAEAHAFGIQHGQHSPILIVIDPDETSFENEFTWYGVMTDLRIGHLGWFPDDGTGSPGNRYEISMTVRELLP